MVNEVDTEFTAKEDQEEMQNHIIEHRLPGMRDMMVTLDNKL